MNLQENKANRSKQIQMENYKNFFFSIKLEIMNQFVLLKRYKSKFNKMKGGS